MKPYSFKIVSGILAAVYFSSIALSGAVYAIQEPEAAIVTTPATEQSVQRGYNPETGRVSFIGGGNPVRMQGMSSLNAASDTTLQDRAFGFLSIYGVEFGLSNPAQELKLINSQKDESGNDVVHYQQMHNSVPVMAGELIINMNANGELLSINGEVSPDLKLDTSPRVDEQAASTAALNAAANWHAIKVEELTSTTPELWIFDESLLTSSIRPVELVWRIEVTPADATLPIREMVLVNAQTGEVSFHENQVDTQTTTWPVYFDLVVDETRGWIYGSDSSGNKIDVISSSTLTLIKSFTLVNGSTPKGIALSPDGSELAIAQYGASSILFLNPDSGTTIATVIPNTVYTKAPLDVIYGRTGRLYSSGTGDYYLHVIDTITHLETSRSPFNSSLTATRLSISADMNWLYASRSSGSPMKLYRYDVSTDTLLESASTAHTSNFSASTFILDPVNNQIFTDTGQVWTNNLKGNIGSTGYSGQVAYVPFHNAIAIASSSTNSVIFTSAQNFYALSTYSVQGPMGPIVAQSDGNKVFVSTSNGIISINLSSFPPGIPSSLPTGSPPYFDLVIDEARGVIYGSNTTGHKIDIISSTTLQVIDQIRFSNGARPQGMDLSPDGNELSVALGGSSSLAFINTNTRTISASVIPNVDGAIIPFDVKYGRAGRLYSSGAGGLDYLHVFDTTTHTEIGKSSQTVYSAPYLSISADKNSVYASEATQTLRLFDVSTDSPTVSKSADGTFRGTNSLLLADNSKLFTSAGDVWLSNLAAKIGSFNASGHLVEIPGQGLVAVISSSSPGQITFVKTGDFYTASTASIPSITSVGAGAVSAMGDKLFINTNNGIKVLNITPGDPTSISIISGSSQSVQVSTQFQQPLKVKVQNVTGNPMPGITVTFTAPSTAASSIFSDTSSNVTTAITDENGIATSSMLTANNVAGAYSVRATIPNLTASADFQLTNLAAVTCTITNGTDPASLFLPYKHYNCGKTSHGMAIGDFNNDGRKDIAISGAGSLLVFLQDSNGSLQQPRVYGTISQYISAGDVNNDGLEDIVSADSSWNTISVYLQRNDGTLAYRVTYPTGLNANAIAVGDVNNDGRKDVVVSHRNSAFIGVFTQNSNGTLNPMVSYESVTSGNDDIAIGDLNDDGLNDVVKMNGLYTANPNLQVYLQTSNGTLGAAIPYSAGCNCMGSGIGVGDVTGDGRSDVIMSYGGNKPSSKIAVFAQDENGNLEMLTSYASYDIPTPVEIADVNSDELLDVVTLHDAWGRAGVYLQEQNGTLGTESLYILPNTNSSYDNPDLSIGDVNSDGLPDIVLPNYTGLVILYRNTTTPSTPTPIPTFTPSNTPGPTFTPGPGPTRTPGPTSTAGPTPTVVPPGSSGTRQTYTASGGSSLPGTFLCDQNQASCTNGADPDADAAHQYAADTFVFYNTHHQRSSFDGQGSAIISTVHFGVQYQNAFWNGYQMVYGDDMAADDVVGHEITHGVTQYTSNLVYSYQSGAINESLSDIWGEFIDQINGSGNDSPSVQWLMGEDTPLGVIRSMSYPTAYGDPDKMSSPYFYTGSGDNGGVHTNSGVNNKAVYLMVQGGTFNGRTITGIGMDKTAAVYYEAQTHLLTAGANYNDLYYALIQACQNLTGGANGITTTDCLQVKLAAEAVEMVTVPANTPTPSLVPTFSPTSSQPATVVPTNTPSPIPTKTYTPTAIPTMVISPTPISSGDTVRISVNSSGEQGLGYSFESSISADGRYIAFESHADNLVSGDTNNQDDIFLHERLTGETTRVSVSSAGLQANNVSIYPSLSANGQYVAFSSAASNLVPDDTNTKSDVFLYDMQTRTTTRISVDSSGVQANGDSYSTSISTDGRYIAFRSDATNLVSGDTNNLTDIFVHDMQTGVTSRVSVDSSGIQANSESYGQSISANGRYISFESLATNLVTGDTNAKKDVFVYDRQTGITTRVSVDSSGIQGNDESYAPSISGDGRYVVFESGASNLVSGDTNTTLDVFLHDRQTGTTTRVSLDTNGGQSNGFSGNSFITLSGNRVVFESNATNLVPNDTNAISDIFVRDLQTGQTTRVSVSSNGTQQGNVTCSIFCYSFKLSASADGTYVTFTSYASNLVPNDTNSSPDVFVHRLDIAPSPTPTFTTSPIPPTLTPSPAPTVTPRHPFLKSGVLTHASSTSQFGTTGGSPSSLNLFDQAGTQDNPDAYVSFQTLEDTFYLGSQSFTLPEDAQSKLVSTMLLQVNFKAPASPHQVWTWSVYNWSTGMWIPIGDSIGTTPDEWQTLLFRIRQPRRYISTAGEIRIQLQSENTGGAVKIDYQALHITYLSIPATATPEAPLITSDRPGIFSVPSTPRP